MAADTRSLWVRLGFKGKDYEDGIKRVQGKTSGLHNQFKKLGVLIGGVFAVSKIWQFGKAVLNVGATFQKFNAILTNTFGSAQEARIEMMMIQEFASKTPFQIEKLTNSYIKLVNRGFKPSKEEMRKLGDVAASTGKDFDQLVEGMLDAMVGEFERLKEFGIKARTEGENVVFAFKGIETTVPKTEAAIRDYILSLGDAEGISGSMAAISETLGGKISNLGDNWDMMLNAMSERTDGVFNNAIDLLNRLTASITRAIKGQEKLSREALYQEIAFEIDNAKKRIADLTKEYQSADPKLSTYGARMKAIDAILTDYNDDLDIHKARLDSIAKRQEQWLPGGEPLFEWEDEAHRIFLESLIDAIEKLRSQTEKEPDQIGIIVGLEKKLKSLKDARKDALSESDVMEYNKQIAELQQRIKDLSNVPPPELKTEDLIGDIPSADEMWEAAQDEKKPKFTFDFEEPDLEDSLAKTERDWEQSWDHLVNLAQKKAQAIADVTGALGSHISGIFSSVSQLYSANMQNEIEQAEATAKAQGKSEEWLAKRKEDIERKYAKKQQSLSIAQAYINIAQGVTKALAQGGILGIALSSMVLAAGMVQIAAIKAQKLGYGGYVTKPGAFIVGDTGEEVVNLPAGAAVTPMRNMGGDIRIQLDWEQRGENLYAAIKEVERKMGNIG